MAKIEKIGIELDFQFQDDEDDSYIEEAINQIKLELENSIRINYIQNPFRTDNNREGAKCSFSVTRKGG